MQDGRYVKGGSEQPLVGHRGNAEFAGRRLDSGGIRG